ncbi:MAG: hydrogenase 4 subunit F, partial [Chromatiaceae bacterium]|nr:hydrogenase 4 subunit F [Chromatiaceae bacterium]
MSALWLMLLAPLAGGAGLFFIRSSVLAGWLNLGLSALSLLGALGVALTVANQEVISAASFRVDALNATLLLLTTFVGLTTALFSRPYMRHIEETGRVSTRALRLYHALYQTFMLTLLIALSTDNLGVLWVAVEGATLATVLLVSLYRTPEAVEAAWKYFILCGVGIALALFGTVLTYFAAQQVLAHPEQGLTWSALYAQAAALDPTVMR